MKWIERERQMSHDFVYTRTLKNKIIDNINNKTGNKPIGTEIFKGILKRRALGYQRKGKRIKRYNG